MTLLPYNEVFYEELVNMFYDMTKEVYPHKVIGNKQNFYRQVDIWTTDGGFDIILAISNKQVVGFSKSYVDYHSGLYDPDYYTELLYVIPEKRNSKALYKLANNISEYAKGLNIDNVINARIDNGFSEIIKKHYNTVSSFIKLEQRNKNG